MRSNSWIALAVLALIIVLAFGQNTRQGVMGGMVTQDEGTYLGVRPIYNFTGTGVTATESSANNRINVDISGASGAPSNLSYVTATTEAGLSAERVLTGTTNRITITDNGGVTGTIVADISSGYVGQTSLTTLGTITSGVWNGTAIGALYGGTGLTAATLGDIVYSSATNTWARLTGNTTTAKLFLTQTGNGSISAAPIWGAIADGDLPSGITRDTEWDTQAEVQTLWGVTIVTGVTGTAPITSSGGGTPAIGLTLLNPGGDADSTTTSNASGLEVVTSSLTLLRGCAANQILKWNETSDIWACAADEAGGGSNHDLLSATHTDTTPAAVARGALVVGQGVTPAWGRLLIGTVGKFLKSDGTDATWETLAPADWGSSSSAANIDDAVTKRHSQNTDTGTTAATWIIQSGGIQGIITTASLATANKTFTLPNVNGTFITTGNLTGITATGTVTSGTWNGSVLAALYGGTGLSSIGTADQLLGVNAGATALEYKALAGTTNRLSVTNAAGSITLNIDTAYVGQSTITTVGTIGTGVWQGTAVADGYVSSAATWNAKPNLVGAGTDGTAAANAGDDTTAARSDHEHYIYRDVVWFYAGTLAAGDPSIWLRLDEAGATGDILGVYAVLVTAGSTASTIDILKSSQANIDGTPSWATLFSTKITIDANERSSNTAAAPPVLSTTSWVANDHFRINVDTAGTSSANLTVKMKIRQKTKAS